MSRPLRIVQIAPFPILPTTAGGKVRIAQLARALCRLGVEVTVVAPYHLTQRRSLAKREPFTLREVPYAPFVLPLLLVDHPFPYGALASFHPGYRLLLPVDLASFDVCQIDHPAFFDLARRVPPSVPIVYGSQNVEFDYVCAESRAGIVRRLAGGRVRSLEAQLVERAAHVFACTEGDRLRFGELYGAPEEKISVIPNGVDLAAVAAHGARRRELGPQPPPRFERRALFSGSAVKHNREAVRAILTRVAPEFEREIEFVILGPCARTSHGALGPNVHLDPDGLVADYVGPGTVGLNPVVVGSGSSLKLLQYLAYGLPVVSTPIGIRGFSDLAPWVTTVELEDFPAALRSLGREPSGLQQQLARYDWNCVAEDALRVYEQLTGRAQPQTRPTIAAR